MTTRRGFPPGVRAIDHVADVGLEIEAPNLPSLLDRAALGMVALLAGAEGAGDEDDMRGALAAGAEGAGHDDAMGTGAAAAGSGPMRTIAEHRLIAIDAADTAQLLADYLRELLYLYEVHRLEYAGARFEELTEARVRADVALVPAADSPVREIKGVTYHGLEAERSPDGWSATVIFDV